MLVKGSGGLLSPVLTGYRRYPDRVYSSLFSVGIALAFLDAAMGGRGSILSRLVLYIPQIFCSTPSLV